MKSVTAALVLAAVAWLAPRGAAQSIKNAATPVCAVAPEQSRFVFRSAFWLNLHNFLHRGAKERRGIHDELPAARTIAAHDTAGTRSLTPDERRTWEAALTFYVSNAVAQGQADSIVEKLNERLARAADDGGLRDVDIDPAVRQTLVAAAPVYRAVWWPVHERRNRDWIASLRTMLALREGCLTRLVADALGGEWPTVPITVDASVYASWFGAYLTQNPVHITMSSNARGNQGSLGLETVLHEAGHAMTGPIESALREAAAREHRRLPRELAHLMLFYSVGEVVREYVPEHVPYADAFGLWAQNSTAREYRTLLETEWLPHLEGRRTFAEAILGIVKRLPRQPA